MFPLIGSVVGVFVWLLVDEATLESTMLDTDMRALRDTLDDAVDDVDRLTTTPTPDVPASVTGAPGRLPRRLTVARAILARSAQKSMSPPPGMAGASFSGLSAMTASVVRNSAAIDAAFCSAERVTLAASMTPILTRSS